MTRTFTDGIVSKVPTEEYRSNYDKIFRKKEEKPKVTEEDLYLLPYSCKFKKKEIYLKLEVSDGGDLIAHLIDEDDNLIETSYFSSIATENLLTDLMMC